MDAEVVQRLTTVGSSYCPLGCENKGEEVVIPEPRIWRKGPTELMFSPLEKSP